MQRKPFHDIADVLDHAERRRQGEATRILRDLAGDLANTLRRMRRAYHRWHTV